MADNKIMETPDFIKGLLESADAIKKLLDCNKISPRYLLKKLTYAKLEEMSSAQRQRIGPISGAGCVGCVSGGTSTQVPLGTSEGQASGEAA